MRSRGLSMDESNTFNVVGARDLDVLCRLGAVHSIVVGSEAKIEWFNWFLRKFQFSADDVVDLLGGRFVRARNKEVIDLS